MLGAIIGDIAGSTFEFNNVKTKDFPLFAEGSSFTDDTICSIAVAEWLLEDADHSSEGLESKLVELGMAFPYPHGGYGTTFSTWLFHPRYLRDCETEEKLQGRKPYHSCGNGSAMRVSAVGWYFDSLEETERVAGISAEVTHNHPEGIKGAQAIAAAIFMARTGATKDAIKAYIEEKYGYNLQRTCDEIRPAYIFADSCPHTVPPAIIAFLESTDFEDAIRLAISLGGDSDTIACMTGGIAEAYYKEIPQRLVDAAWEILPERFKNVIDRIHIPEWTRRANAGDSKAQYILAEIYHEGRIVERDTEKAKYWMREATNQYNIDAAGLYLAYYQDDEPAEYIDLGLPSGTMWAANNIGYSDKYKWGVLLYRQFDEEFLPTDEQAEELIAHCDIVRSEQDGCGVWKVTGPNGNSILFYEHLDTSSPQFPELAAVCQCQSVEAWETFSTLYFAKERVGLFIGTCEDLYPKRKVKKTSLV